MPKNYKIWINEFYCTINMVDKTLRNSTEDFCQLVHPVTEFCVIQRITDEFRFCCLARHVEFCLPPPDEFSSCEDLMSNLVLRVCVWVLGVLATFGNILVIGWRMRYKHTNQVTEAVQFAQQRNTPLIH